MHHTQVGGITVFSKLACLKTVTGLKLYTVISWRKWYSATKQLYNLYSVKRTITWRMVYCILDSVKVQNCQSFYSDGNSSNPDQQIVVLT